MISKLWRTASVDMCATKAPRLGTTVTSPSCASRRNASRSGVRETSMRSHSWRSLSRAPGARSPSMIRSRSRSAMAAGSVR